ncbi:hypothetical protein H7J87_21185 [Mycolicibacterium wolinskyi]|uniref:hypothetical protein n=1 Tax=Mycolicibacterium TaxID=1866885 RepID=UPI00105581C0|nr:MULTISPECIES: hypothetical protein [Mycolicibacterium]MCV7287839.1 hypothetical protein [Mycolicibacterium wolinskyi]MCV7294737.1 hypothetical protein [Mycolicibacterium goodii]
MIWLDSGIECRQVLSLDGVTPDCRQWGGRLDKFVGFGSSTHIVRSTIAGRVLTTHRARAAT